VFTQEKKKNKRQKQDRFFIQEFMEFSLWFAIENVMGRLF
jgi:hypothetical protein